MDDSHSSEILSEDVTNLSYNSSSLNMDDLAYVSLIGNTKASISRSTVENTSVFAAHLSTILDDCKQCISQSLKLVVQLLSDCGSQLPRLTQYMEDAVTLLQMLSNFMKKVVESMSMSCCSLKTFPTTTGHILLEVFTHCKSSETIYGTHLKTVEIQLKDLFKSGHELQLTYLIILEKNFIFDLTEKNELDIFIEALNINLKIGEIVQSLDVKTMAEQWKAYTTICEKYSSFLMDQNVFNECTKLLCDMVRNNIQTAIEVDQEEKVVIRTMKVTNFTIKILLKIYNILKQAISNDYSYIVDWLVYVYLHNRAYLEAEVEKSSQFINIMSTNVTIPTNFLLKEIVTDGKFLNAVFTYNKNLKEEENKLGYLFLITSLSQTMESSTGETLHLSKYLLIKSLLKCLPDCYVWLNMGLKLKVDHTDKTTLGLYEYLLIHAAALARSMSSEEMCALETTMYEALLGSDIEVAMFAANLWTTLARLHNNKHLVLTQLVSLCQVYQKLENHNVFKTSPQKIHLTYVINALFEIIPNEEKVKIYTEFNPCEGSSNASLWCILKIENLPKELQQDIEIELLDKWKEDFHKITSKMQNKEEMNDLIKLTNLVATCSINSGDDVDKYLLKGWLMACPKNLHFLSNSLDSGTMWYFEYIEALTRLSIAMGSGISQTTSNIVKILHVISEIIHVACPELNLLLIELLCKLAMRPLHDENKYYAENYIIESLKSLVRSNICVIRNKLFIVIHVCNSKYLEQIMACVVNEDALLNEVWINYSKGKIDYQKLREELETAKEYQFMHKCIATKDDTEQNSQYDKTQRTGSTNFDFADIDSLFNNESDSEPACKKAKLNCTETENVLVRIESDTTLLCKTKENLSYEHKIRIKTVLEKLKSLVT